MVTFYTNHFAIWCEFNLSLLHQTVFSYMGCKCNTLETEEFLFVLNYIFSWAHALNLKQHILPSANKLWFSYPVQNVSLYYTLILKTFFFSINPISFRTDATLYLTWWNFEMDTSNIFFLPLLKVISNKMLGSRTLDKTLENKIMFIKY